MAPDNCTADLANTQGDVPLVRAGRQKCTPGGELPHLDRSVEYPGSGTNRGLVIRKWIPHNADSRVYTVQPKGSVETRGTRACKP